MDSYLGGFAFFVLFWVPGPFANAYVETGVILVSTLYLAFSWTNQEKDLRHTLTTRVHAFLGWEIIGTLLLALGMVAWESWVAVSHPSGNTLDGSSYVLYTANLLYHGHFTPMLSPFVNFPAYSPQGVTTWFATAHLLLGIPLWTAPNETTPLFQGLVIIASAALGRSWFKGKAAPLAFALAFTLLIAWPHLLVQGTYDFIAAFPLLLLALGWVPQGLLGATVSPSGVRGLSSAVAVGLSATYTPIPSEVILSGVLLVLGIGAIAGWFQRSSWIPRLRLWGALVVAALVGTAPSILILLRYPPGAGAERSSISLTLGSLNAILNPFIFDPGNIWVSPVFGLHLEFVVLLVGGVLVVVFQPQLKLLASEEASSVIRGTSVGIVGALAVALLMVGPRWGPLQLVVNLSEIALIFVTVEGLLVGMVLTVVLQSALSSREPPPSSLSGTPRRIVYSRILPALIFAVLIVIPLGMTATDLPGFMVHNEAIVSNVSAGDIAALEFLSSQPHGGVLVAPGSAGAYLPAFSSDPVIFPLIGIGGGVGFLAGNLAGPVGVPFEGPASNLTYQSVVLQLTDGNLSSALPQQLTSLRVSYVMVTGASTTLFLPFLPYPLLSDPTEFHLLFESGDAYVFSVPLTGAPS